MNADLRYERRGSTALITFNRPAARNAMTWDMYQALYDACDDIDSDDAVRVAVLQGAGGKAFVAGTDIRQFLEFSSGEDGLAYERRIGRVIDRVQTVTVPTVAVVNGYAVGGGLVIAAACDLRVATPSAQFGLPIARTLGNCVSMGTCARLVSLIGPARALELVYMGQFISAERAVHIGLVSEVVSPDDLGARVHELCELLAAHAPKTMWAAKEALRRLCTHGLPDADDLVSACYGSEDFREGVAAFTEKRPPVWTGR
jgi:enoyl-CoA hydratase/carnithine racemase